MRALILSDIHANLEALEAVLDDAQARGGFDVIWCLGDTVGYGPDPGACIDRIREFELVAVAGNHDHAAVGLIDASDFNDAAKFAASHPTADGVVDLPVGAKRLSKDGKVRVLTLKQDVRVYLFVTWHGRGANFTGILYSADKLDELIGTNAYGLPSISLDVPARGQIDTVDANIERTNVPTIYQISFNLD